MVWMEGEAAAIARARAGDRDAFRELVERHSRAVFRLAYHMTGKEEDAEDVVQETFLNAWRWIGRFEARAGFGTWLHRIAVNCSMDALRRRQKHPGAAEGWETALAEAASPEAGPDRLAMSAEASGRVSAALGELSPFERAAFVLRHYEGLRIEEIAARMGRGVEGTKQAVFRAVQKLRRTLGVYAASR